MPHPLEQAARAYCEALGEDPDQMIPVESMIAGATSLVPQWNFAAEKLQDLSLMLGALRKFPAVVAPATEH